jgi:SAM-dependent methyltransferase
VRGASTPCALHRAIDGVGQGGGADRTASLGRGFYESRVFPWLNDRLSADPALQQIRAEAVSGARGRVLEIGFGSGLNLAHYPPAVQSLVAVDPNEGMHARARPRIAAAPFPVEVIQGTAERLPLADARFWHRGQHADAVHGGRTRQRAR